MFDFINASKYSMDVEKAWEEMIKGKVLKCEQMKKGRWFFSLSYCMIVCDIGRGEYEFSESEFKELFKDCTWQHEGDSPYKRAKW